MPRGSNFLTDIVICYGPMLVSGLYALYAMWSGSYQRKSTRFEMVFLPPVAVAVFLVNVPFSVLVAAAFTDGTGFINPFTRQSFSTYEDAVEAALAFGAVASALYWSIIRWYVKTCALVLNLDQRTYRIVKFSPGPTGIRTGPWDDIEGISIDRFDADGLIIYRVELKLRGVSRAASQLGGFFKRYHAELFAARLARELDLPLVAP